MPFRTKVQPVKWLMPRLQCDYEIEAVFFMKTDFKMICLCHFPLNTANHRHVVSAWFDAHIYSPANTVTENNQTV